MYKDREVKLEYNRIYTSNLVQQRRGNGLCLNCGKPAREGLTQCQACADYHTQRLLERRITYKRRAVEYLGEKCVDCDFRTDIIAVYDFHHVRGEKKATIARMLDTVKRRNWTNVCCFVQIATGFVMH